MAIWAGYNMDRTRNVLMSYQGERFCLTIPRNMPLDIIQHKTEEFIINEGGDPYALLLQEQSDLIRSYHECMGMADAAYGVGDMLAGQTYAQAAELLNEELNILT